MNAVDRRHRDVHGIGCGCGRNRVTIHERLGEGGDLVTDPQQADSIEQRQPPLGGLLASAAH